MDTAAGIVVGALADSAVGDPRRWHPVAGFGRCAAALEEAIYAPTRARGAVFTAVCVAATALVGAVLSRFGALGVVIATWTALGGRSLAAVGESMADALDAAADSGAAICLMHMLGEPGTMQQSPNYDDVCGDIQRFFTDRILACQFAGIDKKRIVIDPGFGFGKTLEHNLELLARLESFKVLGCPILVGLSRKRMIANLTGREAIDARVSGSVAAALIAVQRGAAIVRVHDVAATRDALAVWQAVAAHSPAQPAISAKPRIGSSLFEDD